RPSCRASVRSLSTPRPSPPEISATSSLTTPATAAPSPLSTLSLHDALPISGKQNIGYYGDMPGIVSTTKTEVADIRLVADTMPGDRKSTRLNSSHEWISYAVFCLKKKTLMALGGLGFVVRKSLLFLAST